MRAEDTRQFPPCFPRIFSTKAAVKIYSMRTTPSPLTSPLDNDDSKFDQGRERRTNTEPEGKEKRTGKWGSDGLIISKSTTIGKRMLMNFLTVVVPIRKGIEVRAL